jgi:hypothetical protein
MEPLDEERGERDQRRALGRRRRRRHRRRDRVEPRARGEALGARLAPVLAAVDHAPHDEQRLHACTATALRLDHRGREGQERRRPGGRGHGPITTKPNTVEQALPEPAEPAVERREVERREPRRGLAEPLGRLDVALRRRRDDRHRKRLPRHEIGREHPESAPARIAPREGDPDLGRLLRCVVLPEEDRAALDAAPRQAKAELAAAGARGQPQPARHLAAALTKVGEERTMLERHNRRNGLGTCRSRFVGGERTPPFFIPYIG